ARRDLIDKTKASIVSTFKTVRKQLDDADHQIAKAETELKKQDWRNRLRQILMPDITLPALSSQIVIPTTSLNGLADFAVPDLALPKIEPPTVKLPDLIDLQQLGLPDVAIPALDEFDI